jgi:hypothetical protein
MLDKLAALGLIEKIFDGNTTRIKIKPITGILEPDSSEIICRITIRSI